MECTPLCVEFVDGNADNDKVALYVATILYAIMTWWIFQRSRTV